MACGGPSQEHAYQIGDKICDEVLAIMREKYHVRQPHLPADGFGYLIRLHEEWAALETKLRETIRELVWTDHAQG